MTTEQTSASRRGWRARRRQRGLEFARAVGDAKSWFVVALVAKVVAFPVAIVGAVLLATSDWTRGAVCVAVVAVCVVAFVAAAVAIARRAKIAVGRALLGLWLVPTWSFLTDLADIFG